MGARSSPSSLGRSWLTSISRCNMHTWNWRDLIWAHTDLQWIMVSWLSFERQRIFCSNDIIQLLDELISRWHAWLKSRNVMNGLLWKLQLSIIEFLKQACSLQKKNLNNNKKRFEFEYFCNSQHLLVTMSTDFWQKCYKSINSSLDTLNKRVTST